MARVLDAAVRHYLEEVSAHLGGHRVEAVLEIQCVSARAGAEFHHRSGEPRLDPPDVGSGLGHLPEVEPRDRVLARLAALAVD